MAKKYKLVSSSGVKYVSKMTPTLKKKYPYGPSKDGKYIRYETKAVYRILSRG